METLFSRQPVLLGYMSTRDAGSGGTAALDSLFTVPRAVVEGGLDIQREVADHLLDRIDGVDDARRRRRLASHYAAVQAVDRIEDAHPDEDPSLDPLYDGVGRTFDIVRSLDRRTHELATDTVRNTTTVSERLVGTCVEATEFRTDRADATGED
jgi:hypothetical protein